MKHALEEILTIPGVVGGYALHTKQGVSSCHLPDSLQKTMLPDISRQLLKIFSASRMNFKSMKDISLHYDGLVLYLRQAAEQLFMVAICEPSVNTNVLSMSASLAIEEIQDFTFPEEQGEKTEPKQPVEAQTLPEFTPETIRESGPLVKDLDCVEQALASVMGPMSEMILDDAISEWLQTVKASYETLPVLIKILSREIDDADKSSGFQSSLSHYI